MIIQKTKNKQNQNLNILFRFKDLNAKIESVEKIINDKNVSTKIHSVLTYKMENDRIGCINRDMNAVFNMKKIVIYWFNYKKRPLNYQRPMCNPIR